MMPLIEIQYKTPKPDPDTEIEVTCNGTGQTWTTTTPETIGETLELICPDGPTPETETDDNQAVIVLWDFRDETEWGAGDDS